MATVKVHGLAELTRKIKALPAEADKEIRKQVLKSSNRIRKAAQQRVPVQFGALKKSIRSKLEKDKLSATIGPRGKVAWRAHFTEFGTIKSAAKPFMNPAWEEERPKYLDEMAQVVRRVIDQA